jgi:hypothetical protein
MKIKYYILKMDRLKNNFKIDSIKAFVPSLYNSTKDKVAGAYFSILQTEADRLIITQNTDKEIIDLLISKMDIEVIWGLKYILSVSISNNSISLKIGILIFL